MGTISGSGGAPRSCLGFLLLIVATGLGCSRFSTQDEVSSRTGEPAAGCGKGADCDAGVCEGGRCVEAPAAKTAPTAAPLASQPPSVSAGATTRPPVTSGTAGTAAAPTPTSPGTVIRTFVCEKEIPGEARSGCVCDDKIHNPCYDKDLPSEYPQSPAFTIQGNTCVFECAQ